MRAFLRNLFSFDNLMITIGTCCAVALLYFVPQNFDFLSPVSQALGDFDLTDMVFSRFRDDDRRMTDSSIVLVNVGDVDRATLALMIENIGRQRPAAVGIDVFFRSSRDAEGDDALEMALAACPSVVLATKLDHRKAAVPETTTDVVIGDATAASDDDVADHELQAFEVMETSLPRFTAHTAGGFANLIVDESAGAATCREVSLREPYRGRDMASFALRLAELAEPSKAARARARPLRPEVVNYLGDERSFTRLDVDQVTDPTADLSMLRDRIVIMGYMGRWLGDSTSIEDKFFTPLNDAYVGRSLPDMYGVVIHANVLSMILREDYVDGMTMSQAMVVGLLLLIVNVMLFTWIYTHAEAWYDTLALALQLIQSVAMVWCAIVVFDAWSYKLVLTPALLGVALVGTVHDLYQDSLKKLVLGTMGRLRRVSNGAVARTQTPTNQEDP